MDDRLQKINTALQEAVDAFEGPLNDARLSTLQTTDTLPNAQIWNLASQTIDLADRLLRLLQPPALQLAEGYLAYIDTKCLCAAVENSIPDLLASGPLTVDEIASRTSLQPLRLKQIMRVLHNNAIFAYADSTQTYSNNPASTLLRRDHWTQWHRWVPLYGSVFYDFASSIPSAIRAGESRTAAQIACGTEKNIFSYFAEQEGMQAKFHAALGAGAVAQAPGLLANYAWHELGDATVLEVGGGGGDFITALLRSNPMLHGALFELESVVDMVRPKFRDPKGEFADVGARMVDLHVGDFLKEVPTYEVYTMKWCLHNWSDADVVRILQVVRRAIQVTQRARMVILEAVLADGRSSRVWRYGDVTMMATVNGQERTEVEWRALASKAGWRVESITALRNVWAAAIDLRPI
ncbi:S-adenosyl-L-methionine-dependent methyltransferase [Westerdykella ornata]|uniref:S-adenosyl-L-methionine-dependent methyltransferase n=1 Tax=Westerdykella ornata TaxID=318751 RepID=A0A6A6JVU8_WESOR|nr:S-adenosyl-L-methionine-dependent methyltransferase [Westerdykella ornata]KAF2280355.1 S-adenosyl-L-methionine-dependent methyltransferase [Westerdykella ornata]